MIFYCLYDLIDYYREEKQETHKEMFSFFLKKGFKKSTVEFFKNNCAVESVPEFIPVISEYTGLTELEIFLSVGIIPEGYKQSFFKNVHDIAELLQLCPQEPLQAGLQPFLNTNLGTLYNADCVEVLKRQPAQSVDLVFADPPFNLSKKYDNGIKDNLSMSEYISW